jgi:hypothetical protein
MSSEEARHSDCGIPPGQHHAAKDGEDMAPAKPEFQEGRNIHDLC